MGKKLNKPDKLKGFADGLKNIVNHLSNSRSAQSVNQFANRYKVGNEELRAIYKTGIGNRIISIKSRYALNDTIQFSSDVDREFFEKELFHDVNKAAEKMLAYGRSIIVLFRKGDDLSKPFIYETDNPHPIQRRVFDGDMVNVVGGGVVDLMDDRYNKPMSYMVAAAQIHWSRVIDFTYVTPPDRDMASYSYGGISEFELIYPQLINDAVIERCTGSILEKSSSIFYKLDGYRDRLASEDGDKEIIAYFTEIENLRSIYGAGIIDKNDEVTSVTQALNNLSETDMISLRRLAMVTGIPVSWLVGENVKGLNSSGDNERQILQDTVETIQRTYLMRPINELLLVYGKEPITFKDNQGETPIVRLDYETKAIDNAVKLDSIGGDAENYLIEHDVIKRSVFDMFEKDVEEAGQEELNVDDILMGLENETSNQDI